MRCFALGDDNLRQDLWRGSLPLAARLTPFGGGSSGGRARAGAARTGSQARGAFCQPVEARRRTRRDVAGAGPKGTKAVMKRFLYRKI